MKGFSCKKYLLFTNCLLLINKTFSQDIWYWNKVPDHSVIFIYGNIGEGKNKEKDKETGRGTTQWLQCWTACVIARVKKKW